MVKSTELGNSLAVTKVQVTSQKEKSSTIDNLQKVDLVSPCSDSA